LSEERVCNGFCVKVSVCTMAGKAKRMLNREEKLRNVRKKGALPPVTMVIITNMEPIKLDLCLRTDCQQNFRRSDMFGFMRWSEKLPPVDVALVEEFVRNYDPNDGSSIVQDRIVGIEAWMLHKALYLPVAELAVGEEESADFVPQDYFKKGEDSYEKGQGWKIQEVIRPELGEWMRFVLKRLALNRHSTYMAKKLLYTTIVAFDGMQFNWAEYAASRIHGELEQKRRTGKFPALLCSNYISEVVKYQLQQPVKEQEKTKLAKEPEVEKLVETIELETEAPIPPEEEANQSKGKAVAEPSLELVRPKPILVEKSQPILSRNQFEGQTSSQGQNLRQSIMDQILQLQSLVVKLEDQEELQKALTGQKRLIDDQKKRIVELEKKIADVSKESEGVQAKWLEKEEAWNEERQYLMTAERAQCLQLDIVTTQWREEKIKKEAAIEGEGKLKTQLAEHQEQSKKKIEELQVQITSLQDLVKTAKEPVSVPVLDNSAVELKKELELQQRINKEQDERVEKLESQVRELGADNEDLTAQLMEREEEMSQDGEEDEVEVMGVAQELVEPLQELAAQASTEGEL
jgi:hypothetical protein